MLTEWFSNVKSVGITSGASTPDELVKEVIDKISTLERLRLRSKKVKRKMLYLNFLKS